MKPVSTGCAVLCSHIQLLEHSGGGAEPGCGRLEFCPRLSWRKEGQARCACFKGVVILTTRASKLDKQGRENGRGKELKGVCSQQVKVPSLKMVEVGRHKGEEAV